MVAHSSYWHKGIGKSLMREIETFFGDAERYELFTRIDYPKTRPFYQSLGYLPFKAERISDSLTFVYLEKLNDRRGRS